MNDMHINRNRRDRGSILTTARNYGVDGVSFEGLERIFRQAGKFGAVGMLEENVQYLVEKGYLKKDLLQHTRSGVQRWMLYVTPLGIDLIDGSIDPDPGVDLIV